MAALHEVTAPRLVELRDLTGEELEPLLEEETLAWRTQLSWDFSPSADLVRRFLKIQALTGYALVYGGRPIGYSYYVCEDHKALIGDLFVLREFSSIENEDRLLTAVLRSLATMPYLR